MSKEYKKKVIVGYNIDRNLITQEDLRARVISASKRVKSGDFLTQEEVAKFERSEHNGKRPIRKTA